MHLFRGAVTIAAMATFALGATAPLAFADTGTAPGQQVLNHGTCVANDFPNAKDTGPLTSNKNNLNFPSNDRDVIYMGCNVAK